MPSNEPSPDASNWILSPRRHSQMETTLSPDSIDRFLSYIAVNGGSQNTTKAYGTDLRMARQWLTEKEVPDPDWQTLEVLMATYLNELQESKLAPTTIRRKMASLRSWAKWAGHPGFLGSYRTPTPPRQEAHPLREGIDGVERMLHIARKDVHKALIALQGLCGLRVNEALTCEADWFVFEPSGVSLRVLGKGNKVRIVPVSSAAWTALMVPWATAMRSQDHRLVPLTDRAARRAITRIAARAGLDGDTASHDLRATFATAAWHASDDGTGKKDLRTVQELMGHANSSTTEGYIGTTDADMRAAVEFDRKKDNEDD